MSEQDYQLVHPYFEVNALQSGSTGNHVHLRINSQNPDIVSVTVGGIRITTVRENWTRIYVLLSRIVTADELVRSFQAVTPGEWIETAVLP